MPTSRTKLYPHVHMPAAQCRRRQAYLAHLHAVHRQKLADHAAKKGPQYIVSLWICNDIVVLNSYPYHMVPYEICQWFETHTPRTKAIMVTHGDATLLAVES
jgi:hypothetical protein